MTLFATGPTLPLRRLLIANRGEIAVRIIRACRDEGIETVAVYADADRDAPFVGMADQAFALGGDKPAETYLDGAKIIAIARRAGADAIHPGYGFLSENAGFAQAVQDAGLIWIGPDPAVITALGDKIEARRIAEAVGAPWSRARPARSRRRPTPWPSPASTAFPSPSRQPLAAAGAA
ncbi:biotin carboxylase N-terminal domain-containing protein [Paracoccus aerius]